MYIAVDWDRTVVEDGPYDATTPMRLIPGAREGLLALKQAGHYLLLWSARASKALMFNPDLDPFVRAGVRRINRRQWEHDREIHLARYQQMIAFVDQHLPDVFDAIDDGAGGKPSVDLFIDDKALCLGNGIGGVTWREITCFYGMSLPVIVTH